MNFLLATRNKIKVEFYKKEITTNMPGSKVLSLTDFSGDLDIGEIEETGKTYIENSSLKAHVAMDRLQERGLNTSDYYIIAEDTGFEVEVLAGFPGLKTKRWFGEEKEKKWKELFKIMKSEDVRDCRFVTWMTCIFPVSDNLLNKERIVKKSFGTRACLLIEDINDQSERNPFKRFGGEYLLTNLHGKSDFYKYISDLSWDEDALDSEKGMALRGMINLIRLNHV